MKKNLLLLMLALLLPAFMYGQEQTVSGTVLDTYNMGVPGASIVEKGTTNGTITDFDGNYTLTVSNKNATLVFSFIGYKTQEVPVAGKAKVDVILQENAEQLDEVVVTGYGGSQKRATLTTSISKLDNAVLENAAMSNAGQSLQGTVSGLRVVNTTGQPGANPNIVLRGGATITGKDKWRIGRCRWYRAQLIGRHQPLRHRVYPSIERRSLNRYLRCPCQWWRNLGYHETW